jgi:hypothetical protein
LKRLFDELADTVNRAAGHRPRERQPGRVIGDDRHLVPQRRPDRCLAVRAVGQGEHRVGVGVVDEAAGEDGVDRGLDRRVRRVRVEEAGAQRAQELPVVQVLREPEKPPGGFEVDRNVVLRAGAGQIRPDALTKSAGRTPPKRSRAAPLTEVLPPPWSTSSGSAPRSRLE